MGSLSFDPEFSALGLPSRCWNNALCVSHASQQVQASELHLDHAWILAPFLVHAANLNSHAHYVRSVLLRIAPDAHNKLLSNDLLRNWHLHLLPTTELCCLSDVHGPYDCSDEYIPRERTHQ